MQRQMHTLEQMSVFIGTATFTRLLRHSHVPVRQVQEQLAEIVNVLPQEEQVVEQIVGTSSWCLVSLPHRVPSM